MRFSAAAGFLALATAALDLHPFLDMQRNKGTGLLFRPVSLRQDSHGCIHDVGSNLPRLGSYDS